LFKRYFYFALFNIEGFYSAQKISMHLLFNLLLPLVISLLASYVFNLFAISYYLLYPASVLIHLLLSATLFFIYKKKLNPKEYTQLLFGSNLIKFLLCLFGLIAFYVIDKAHFGKFSLHYLVHYVLFTIFELNYLFKNIKLRQAEEKHIN
jgi:hypothetical protein